MIKTAQIEKRKLLKALKKTPKKNAKLFFLWENVQKIV